MPRIAYIDKTFSAGSLDLIERSNAIIAEWNQRGFSLTLRQLYYQFVARGWLRNRDQEYKRLGSVVSDARLAGLIDWRAIEDRTRFVRTHASWERPQDIVEAAARSYRIDLWEGQPDYVEVWIEKDALVGIIEPTCNRWRVPYFSCRGYTSQSEMWEAGQRLLRESTKPGRSGRAIVLHLGDHDPSGLDMTRDIRERLDLFIGDRVEVEVRRLALNMDQVEAYNPPPNPAKVTDSRAGAYIARYGSESWELDALDPDVLAGLIAAQVEIIRDHDAWDARVDQEARERDLLASLPDRWEEIVGEA